MVACTTFGLIGVFIIGMAFYRMQKRRFTTRQVDYPTYGITGPSKKKSSTTSKNSVTPLAAMDARLASSAELFHYHQAKQQIVAMEKKSITRSQADASCDSDSDVEHEEGSISVYECPGLAPTSNVEINNPLYKDPSSKLKETSSNSDHKQSTKRN
uniref:Neural proliferation differentiation and control protein 1 n=1 Tax=Romanomermis culicivorax TaxID=13658 RepID=A0A915HIQ3_ROMCU